MFRKLTLALFAAASLGAMALAPTAASAGWKHHHYYPHGHGLNFIVGGYGYGGEGCYRTRLVPTKFGYRYRIVNVCAW
ncbi:hypothetical protein [Bradyrhizobium sp.]|uniref:hypothetical protein n=1 Tax=Bradyrhizobium sp. TaxID=376 RepID=UPI0025C3F93D|nr:hypothetical protein [Bradyrhizobium sp.]